MKDSKTDALLDEANDWLAVPQYASHMDLVRRLATALTVYQAAARDVRDDRERLDWLDHQGPDAIDPAPENGDQWGVAGMDGSIHASDNLREAIDGARAVSERISKAEVSR